MKSITKAIDADYVTACHDLSDGGLAVTASEMAFTGDYGVDIWLNKVPQKGDIRRNDQLLFSESNSRFLVEVPEDFKSSFEGVMEKTFHSAIGKVRQDKNFSIYGLSGKKIVETNIKKLLDAWKKTFGD
jgi:phosphoribosylformylglycinamidine synthase